MSAKSVAVGTIAGAVVALLAALAAFNLKPEIRAYLEADKPGPTISVGEVEFPPVDIGRFTIVNGTPNLTRNIMLLDTVTGAAWIFCTNSDGESRWCAMERTTAPGRAPN